MVFDAHKKQTAYEWCGVDERASKYGIVSDDSLEHGYDFFDLDTGEDTPKRLLRVIRLKSRCITCVTLATQSWYGMLFPMETFRLDLLRRAPIWLLSRVRRLILQAPLLR